MKIQKFEDNGAWLMARRGKITGSRLKDLIVKRGTKQKIGFYEMIAERLGIPADGEDAMGRGHRLEPEALEAFTKVTGKKADPSLVIWSRDDNEAIAISPDGIVEGENAAVEIKCLSSARHIEAVLTDEVPDEYEYQVLQYFVVNDTLETLYLVFYDPRLLARPFHMITVPRSSLKAEIEAMLETQRVMLAEVDRITLELSGF